MAQRRSSVRPRTLAAHRRVPALIGTAALAALAVSVLAPSADAVGGQVENRQAALILAEDATVQPAAATQDDGSPELSAQAASAQAQAQARVQTLAAATAAARSAAAAAPQSPAAAPASSFPATTAGYQAYAESNVGATQFRCLDALWTKESHWRTTAHNPSSTAYGIPQLLDSTWHYTGVGKTSDGFRQVDAGLAYLRRAYPAGPCSAWAHSQAHGWY